MTLFLNNVSVKKKATECLNLLMLQTYFPECLCCSTEGTAWLMVFESFPLHFLLDGESLLMLTTQQNVMCLPNLTKPAAIRCIRNSLVFVLLANVVKHLNCFTVYWCLENVSIPNVQECFSSKEFMSLWAALRKQLYILFWEGERYECVWN